ncbi:MAG: hypothetical protein ABEI96_08335 [Haloarculaceae archaeon]
MSDDIFTDGFRHRFNWALCDLSATDDERPDTAAYRFEGFGPISGERAAQ